MTVHISRDLLLTALVVLGALDGAAAATGEMSPVLAPDPKVTALVGGLGENGSCYLPPVKTLGRWNKITTDHYMDRRGPGGRDYTIRAVWMPGRKRAFFCGANHGSPHRVNDAWEYDLPSNTWVMLFAPDPNNATGVMEIKEFEYLGKGGAKETAKYVQTKRGGPTHYGHTWWGLAYDPNMKAALWMNVGIGGSAAGYMKQRGAKDCYDGPPLWAFQPYERKWRPVLTSPPRPRAIYAGAMEYVPELGGVFWYAAGWQFQGMWVYRPKTNTWEDLKPNGGKNLYHNKQTPRTEAVMAYDRENKIVVAVSGKATYHYSVKANAWAKVVARPKDAQDVPHGHDARTPFGYDPIGKVCLLYSSATPAHMWAYSAGAKKWTKHAVNGPKGPGRRLIGYFDRARNAFVVDGHGKVWVYRHRQTAAK